MSIDKKTPKQQAAELIEMNREIDSLVGDEAQFLMTTRSDLMSLATLLIEKGLLDEGDFTNALYEGRKTLLNQLKAKKYSN